ncbi:unnamed protein product (macronuclear) [Paramecium tetraurelia]|uniref:Tyrosine-protein phosphatase domain-containing protein n=1 Tax=Paramecium tetraurelia TaxID=5888 RepID=A0C4Z9_PARTE|nr:uncharacterized protein GSPATT00006365001 [Paramecium tetraurelia]CAK65866.1 unnamed protein product [Paramecium tetraurelia]|eukprot:XP_001433263.1 hypothetical protein (macronuclear) [Paramecium tetraurelia strain d4-2]
MTQNQIVGAIKIKDGLFIGDEYASQDREFIMTNKVTHIINCAGTEVQNKWTLMGAKYLTFNWLEQDNEVLFDERNENVNKIFTFIEECFQQGESCLVHSVRGQSRACCVLAAYFMKKYSWTLYKTLEYLNSRRPDLEIRASFFYQLNALENRMTKQGPKRTASWNELTSDEQNPSQVQDELIIRNTFLNSHNGPVDEIYTNLQAKQGVLGKVTNQKLKWKDQANKENISLATIVYSGSPDFVPVSEINLKADPTTPSILKGAQKSQSLVQPPKQPQIQSNFPKSSQNAPQVRSASSKSQQQDQSDLQLNSNITSANLTNNPSFQNLLMHCAMKTRTPQQQQQQQEQAVKKNTLINNLIKPQTENQNIQSIPQIATNLLQLQVQANPSSGIRSNSLQQTEDKRNQTEANKNNRPSSVKQKDNQPSILTNFQEFKNQVQQSLNYFNKQQETISNMDKQSLQSQTTQLTTQSNVTQQQQQQQLLIAQNNTAQQKNKLEQLISPTLIQQMNSTKHSEIQKTLTQSISQLQSSYQKFQQLQQKNQIKQSQSQSCIQKQNAQVNEVSVVANPTGLNLVKVQERSTSLTKKQDNLDFKNRPNSAEVNDGSRGVNQLKKESLSPFQKEAVKKVTQQGPPLPQSSSQIYLRNVQCRRQAASTLRNQQKPNNSFQDKYLNQSANQVQNNSSFNNNSNSAIEADQKQSTKGVVTDLNQFKKLISPQNLTKSQAQFVKNQPIRVLQELTEKTQSQKQVKAKDNVSSTSFTLVQKPSTVNTRTFSPAIKNETKNKPSNPTNTNVRQKFRNSSPGITKDQDSSNSLQNVSTTFQGKNSWKML